MNDGFASERMVCVRACAPAVICAFRIFIDKYGSEKQKGVFQNWLYIWDNTQFLLDQYVTY